jgi:hypothetical protein
MTIKAWGAGKWYCEKCDVRENEYGRVMVSWTASWPPPKFCWKCFAKKWESQLAAAAEQIEAEEELTDEGDAEESKAPF